MKQGQTPEEIRILHLEIRLRELENENLKLKEGDRKPRRELQRKIAFGFLIMSSLWSFAIFTMLCAIVIWPELAEPLDQFIVGFGSLATGIFLGSSGQKVIDKLFE